MINKKGDIDHLHILWIIPAKRRTFEGTPSRRNERSLLKGLFSCNFGNILSEPWLEMESNFKNSTIHFYKVLVLWRNHDLQYEGIFS